MDIIWLRDFQEKVDKEVDKLLIVELSDFEDNTLMNDAASSMLDLLKEKNIPFKNEEIEFLRELINSKDKGNLELAFHIIDNKNN